jgi:hypothetical protein
MTTKFEPTDGWILHSIVVSRSLAELVAAADHLNCAIPSLEEINGALVRLEQAGLIHRSAGWIDVSDSVRQFFQSYAHEPARTVGERFDGFLASMDVSFEIGCEIRPFNAAELRAAYKKHSAIVTQAIRDAAKFQKG